MFKKGTTVFSRRRMIREELNDPRFQPFSPIFFTKIVHCSSEAILNCQVNCKYLQPQFRFYMIFFTSNTLTHGRREGGHLGSAKKFKMPFFKIYFKILSRGYSNGSRTSPFFSFSNISTNMVARGIQSFGRNGPWLAG